MDGENIGKVWSLADFRHHSAQYGMQKNTSKQEGDPVLNIIHRLKSGMFPTLFFLTSASVLAQPLTISPGHWQEGMAVGVTEFSGTLYVPEVSW